MQAHGEVPSDLRDKINAIEDISILERLVRQAASASSTEAFEAALKKELDCIGRKWRRGSSELRIWIGMHPQHAAA